MARKIGIIGCGNMGEAILRGIISKKIASRRDIFVSDLNSAKLNCIKKIHKVNVTFNNSMVTERSDIVILAVKPQKMNEVLSAISEELDTKKLVISVAAGITTKKIKKLLAKGTPVARVMPNMPALIGKGVSAVCLSGVSSKYRKDILNIFSSIGKVVQVKEKDFDAVTAISGSGPAYFFYLVEVLVKTAISLGLKKDVAIDLAMRTALGSVELLAKSGLDPVTLRKKVTSKGGTTEAAFKLFKKKKLEEILKTGIKKAKKRSKELSGG